MKNMTSPSVITGYMQRADFFFKKNLGQNFLKDENVASMIVDALGAGKEDAVLEIGPGFGALTQFLAPRAGKVITVEIDPFAAGVIEEVFGECENVRLVRGDILRQDISQLLSEYINEGRTVRAISNLPYYITSQVLIRLLTCGVDFENIVVMVQKEVASRLAAERGTKDYSAFTVLLSYYARTEKLFEVKNTCFMPRPKVDSAVMRIVPLKERPVTVTDEERFVKTVRAAFSMRRKTLLNCISSGFGIGKDEASEMIRSAGFDPSVRGETLSLEDFAALSEKMPSSSED